uniref:Uncharacterized protein n=1 Tax=Salix viminalis TaxID=40686 RepID=A0A6N2JW90_SALVM
MCVYIYIYINLPRLRRSATLSQRQSTPPPVSSPKPKAYLITHWDFELINPFVFSSLFFIQVFYRRALHQTTIAEESL